MKRVKIMVGGHEIKGIKSTELPSFINEEAIQAKTERLSKTFDVGAILTALPADYDLLWNAANAFEIQEGEYLSLKGLCNDETKEVTFKCISKSDGEYKFKIVN